MPRAKPRRVAIVGAGPAGRAAARELITAGIAVTIYDKEAEAGGLMRYGYPEYRMPETIPHRDAAELQQLGVEFKFKQELGKTLTLEELRQVFDAVLLTVGAPVPKRLGIPGEDLPGVYQVLGFLYADRINKPLKVGKKVLVIGGGDTAIDAATTAKGLGAGSVRIIYRRDRQHLKAQPHEIKRTLEAGVHFCFDRRPVRIEQAGNSLVLETIRPEGQPERLLTDKIIIAIGQKTNTTFLKHLGLIVHHDGTTNQPDVFVTGGALYGSDRLAKAILSGRNAALRILKKGDS